MSLFIAALWRRSVPCLAPSLLPLARRTSILLVSRVSSFPITAASGRHDWACDSGKPSSMLVSSAGFMLFVAARERMPDPAKRCLLYTSLPGQCWLCLRNEWSWSTKVSRVL